MRYTKRMLAVLLAVLIVACNAGLVAFAAEDEVKEHNTDGVSVGYSLTESTSVITIQEDATPLGNAEISSEACCMLHFVILLVALVLTVVYTDQDKKSQLHEFELRRELAR